MKVFKKLLSACVTLMLLLVGPVCAVVPAPEIKVVDDGEVDTGRGFNPLWLLLLGALLLLVYLDIEASGGREFCWRNWTERALILLLLIRVFLLERRMQKCRAAQEREGERQASAATDPSI
jgi:hypothetical protein